MNIKSPKRTRPSVGVEMTHKVRQKYLLLDYFYFWNYLRNPRGHLLYIRWIDMAPGTRIYMIYGLGSHVFSRYLETSCLLGVRTIAAANDLYTIWYPLTQGTKIYVLRVGVSTDLEILSNFPNLRVDISNIPYKFGP